MRFALLGLLLALLSLAGCGGGDSGGGEVGAVNLAMTDAPSDEIDLFLVNVASLRLHRLDGSEVEALPRSAEVDFADLVALSDLLTVANVPPGTYDEVRLTLDLGGARVHLAGNAADATVLDETGAPAGAATEVAIEFPNDRPLVVVAGLAHLVELDFDLEQSCEVDAPANEVRVGPVFFATADPSDPKPVRLYGRLNSVDTAGESFSVGVLRRRDPSGGRERQILSDDQTVFEIDGDGAVGSAGLALLAAKPAGTRVEVRGRIDPATRTLLARSVEAGTGVFDGTRDLVEGLVIARSSGAGTDPVFAVHGFGIRRDRSLALNRNFVVSAALATTRVRRAGDGTINDTDDINVGQRVIVLGDLTGPAMNATAGLVRLVETGLSGLANGPVAGGVLEGTLRHIGARPALLFNFSIGSTGVADPAHFRIDVGTIPLAGIAADSPFVARGFFPPVDAASGDPDFTAVSVVDRTGAASLLAIRWSSPDATPFSSSDGTGATIDLSTAAVALVDNGGIALQNLLGGANPRIVPGAGGLFAILEQDRSTLHDDFALWLGDVQARLGRVSSPVAAARILAVGTWNAGTRTLTARRIAILMR